MISAIFFILQLLVIAVTDGPKLIRRLRDPAERQRRWRTACWLIILAIVIYAVSIDYQPLGIFSFGLAAFVQVWSLWTDARYLRSNGMQRILWLFTIFLVLFALCAWGVAVAFYLGWEPQ